MACLILPHARASIPAKVLTPLRSFSTLHYYRAKSRENYSSHSASLRDISKSGDSGQMASGLPSHSQIGRGKRVQSEASLTASVVGLQSLRSSQVRAMRPRQLSAIPQVDPRGPDTGTASWLGACCKSRPPQTCQGSTSLGLAILDILQVRGPRWW